MSKKRLDPLLCFPEAMSGDELRQDSVFWDPLSTAADDNSYPTKLNNLAFETREKIVVSMLRQLTALPPRDLLQQKLHAAIQQSRARLANTEEDSQLAASLKTQNYSCLWSRWIAFTNYGD